MTNEEKELKELKELADLYARLIEFPPFQRLVAEKEKHIEKQKEAIINDLTDERLVDKAIIQGMRLVLSEPMNVINEYNKLKENSEPS
jgi:hypothetical protein